MDRITEIYSRLRPCRLFADVGCDHGFVAELVVKNALAEKVYVSDVSEKCLAKAEKLLAVHMRTGLVESFVSDGFAAFPEMPDQALVAGMGGEEIVKILSAAAELPERLVLQPMKNAPKVRRFLADNGYKIAEDVTFRDVRYYDIIAAARGADELSADEEFFGRTNLAERPEAFIGKIKAELADIAEYLAKPMGETARAELLARKERLEKVLL